MRFKAFRKLFLVRFVACLICTGLVLTGCTSRPSGPTRVKEIGESDFQSVVLDSEGVVLVDFWATWCGPCQRQGPVIDELSTEMGKQFVFAKVDIDQHPNLAYEYGIEALPTLMVFKGGKAVEQLVGMHDADQLRKSLESAAAE